MKKVELEALQAESDIALALMDFEPFQVFLEEEVASAEQLCVRVIEGHKSSYEKAMAAGIMKFWRVKVQRMNKLADKGFRRKLRRELEKKESVRSKSESDSFPVAAAYGQF